MPKLLAVTGPLKGLAFPVTEELRIGRDLASSVPVTDASVSRHHSVVVPADGSFVVRDLGSLNGTFVNGIPVKERRLQHGDEIGIGLSRFLFLAEEDSPPEECEPVGDLRFSSTVELRLEDALYADPKRLAAALPASDIAHGAFALLHAGRAAHSARNFEELGRRLLEVMRDVLPASRAAVLVFGRGPHDVVQSFGGDSSGAPWAARVSSTVVSRVAQGRAGFLSNDVIASLPDAQSLLRANVRALVVAPLVFGDERLGLLYADSSVPEAHFGDHDLQFLVALAEIGARAAANLRQLQSLVADRRRLQDDPDLRVEMIGESTAMAALHERLLRVAPTDTTVLILGESGTGKELTAAALHRGSRRADAPLVVINCGALTESLLESELFGHEKGAFTGAVARKLGKLELADKGTVFLDEIGELSPALQAKLLRFLQEREIERVGGTAPIKVDVRVVAATNRDLAAAVETGTFRLDLYYRLNVVSLSLPPLRERAEDVRLLASYFVARHARRINRRVLGITPEAWQSLLRHDWPGNVRELENAIERAVVLGADEWVRPEDLPEALLEKAADAEAGASDFHASVNAAKRSAVEAALAASGGVVTEAAKRLGLHPNYLHRLMRNLGLRT